MKRILGIDPGSHHLGLGCIDAEGTKFELVHAEVLSAPARLDLYERLEVLSLRLKTLVHELHASEVAVEDIFFAKNVRSAFQLGMARGVAVAACLGRGIKIFEYAPAQVKGVVTGHGRADKAQVKKMVQLLLGKEIDLRHDATDALAVALCHAFTGRNQFWGNVHDRTSQRPNPLEKP